MSEIPCWECGLVVEENSVMLKKVEPAMASMVTKRELRGQGDDGLSQQEKVSSGSWG
jgi:hypothetical protein